MTQTVAFRLDSSDPTAKVHRMQVIRPGQMTSSHARRLEITGTIAVDVETATAFDDSICQIGLAWVDGGSGHPVSAQWLCRPPANIYDPANSAIHGLTQEHTADKPPLSDAWSDIAAMMAGLLPVFHNEDFDIAAIRASLAPADIQWNPRDTACTLKIAHALLPDRTSSYSLESLCADFSIDLKNAHDASSDAAATLELAAVLASIADRPIGELAALSRDGAQLRALAARRRVGPKNPTGPASDKQKDYLASLMSQNGTCPADHMLQDDLSDLTQSRASELIDLFQPKASDKQIKFLTKLLDQAGITADSVGLDLSSMSRSDASAAIDALMSG